MKHYKGESLGCVLVWAVILVSVVGVVTLLIKNAIESNTPEGKQRAFQAEIQAEAERQRACNPKRISTSPDGVTLWAVSYTCYKIHGSEDVYFSTRGTSSAYTRLGGKVVTTHNRTVPSD
jgi:hypothetical protein